MKVLLAILCLSFQLMANDYQLSTIVENQQLIPVIKINGQIVIRVKDVGTKQVFLHRLNDRKDFKTLKQLEINALNRTRFEFVGVEIKLIMLLMDNIELYRVTPSDVIGSDLSAYRRGILWRENIYGALKSMVNTDAQVEERNQTSLFLLHHWLGFYLFFLVIHFCHGTVF